MISYISMPSPAQFTNKIRVSVESHWESIAQSHILTDPTRLEPVLPQSNDARTTRTSTQSRKLRSKTVKTAMCVLAEIEESWQESSASPRNGQPFRSEAQTGYLMLPVHRASLVAFDSCFILPFTNNRPTTYRICV
ncbi:unnamed protein product [Phytophthora fragariaefolia]|uniref:Unnamed protein product n=1 Tax=Phytophthora fragariaefolia TaxID=1490495 RepID=A0A9W6XWB3_9STRA|nr:unnamed protein product [Phytophthora fragariaefolia]